MQYNIIYGSVIRNIFSAYVLGFSDTLAGYGGSAFVTEGAPRA